MKVVALVEGVGQSVCWHFKPAPSVKWCETSKATIGFPGSIQLRQSATTEGSRRYRAGCCGLVSDAISWSATGPTNEHPVALRKLSSSLEHPGSTSIDSGVDCRSTSAGLGWRIWVRSTECAEGHRGRGVRWVGVCEALEDLWMLGVDGSISVEAASQRGWSAGPCHDRTHSRTPSMW